MNEIEYIIYNYLLKHGACDTTNLVHRLYDNPGLYEREVKVGLMNLLSKGKVRPNIRWEMEAIV